MLTFQLNLSSDVAFALSFLNDNISSECFAFLSCKILSSSQISTILLDEDYMAKIYLPPIYQQPINFQLYINGDSIPITEHKYIYKHEPTQIGKQTYSVRAIYTDPHNGKTIKAINELTYEVLPTQK